MEALISNEVAVNNEARTVKTEGRLVVVPAHATGDYDGPSYCAFHVTQAFVLRLMAIIELCTEHDLSSARFVDAPELWGPAGIEEELRLHFSELMVTRTGDFWFTDSPKHGSYLVESEMFSVENLQALLDEGTSEIAFANDDCRELYEEDHEDVSPGEYKFRIKGKLNCIGRCQSTAGFNNMEPEAGTQQIHRVLRFPATAFCDGGWAHR